MAKRVKVDPTVRLNAYNLIIDGLECAVWSVVRAAAKYEPLAPDGELTPPQLDRASDALLNWLCERFDFGGRDA
jgi:hypothetical protein